MSGTGEHVQEMLMLRRLPWYAGIGGFIGAIIGALIMWFLMNCGCPMPLK